MMTKRKMSPEELAAEKALDREATERLAASIERYERWLDERVAVQERKRQRLNRLSLGLLGRH
jgi:hypothetical protein